MMLPALFAILLLGLTSLAEETEAPADAFLSEEVKGLRIAAGPAKGTKCARCWMYQESVGSVEDHPEICERCAKVLI